MCIVCHYKGDNGLVYPETRAAEHKDGDPVCLRPMPSHGQRWICFHCGETGKKEDRSHVCSTLPQVVGQSVNVYDHACPKCGAKAGEQCMSRGFDQYGPKARVPKRVPCAVRRT